MKYYGAYPNGFLERARALLGITPLDPLLHVCGGKARDYPAKPRGFGPNDKTLDLDPNLAPDYLQGASEPLPWPLLDRDGRPLSLDAVEALGAAAGLTRAPWPAIIADPPYTPADAGHYEPGAGKFPGPNLILREMLKAVRPGGRVGMLHYQVPSPPKVGVRFVALAAVWTGYNQRIRAFSVFEKEL
ncbi:MAG: hypothetical protein ACYC2H_01470 [Thermoplasmatota archaeon]